MTLAGSQTSGILILDILEQVDEKIIASKNIPILRANRIPDTLRFSSLFFFPPHFFLSPSRPFFCFLPAFFSSPETHQSKLLINQDLSDV